MATLTQQILKLTESKPGLTDREITDELRGSGQAQQPINQTARLLESKGLLVRKRRGDGLIGNYPGDAPAQNVEIEVSAKKNHDVDALSEDEIKSVLVEWLSKSGWTCTVAWGRLPGIDIDARSGTHRWVIEVKGPGSRPQMRVNYFLGILGETLQRMDDSDARYSIALPDLPQYRGLWERLPKLAKTRTRISILFVSSEGQVEEN